jgi:hypothetical protein
MSILTHPLFIDYTVSSPEEQQASNVKQQL